MDGRKLLREQKVRQKGKGNPARGRSRRALTSASAVPDTPSYVIERIDIIENRRDLSRGWRAPAQEIARREHRGWKARLKDKSDGYLASVNASL
jgi:hypothetical protein